MHHLEIATGEVDATSFALDYPSGRPNCGDGFYAAYFRDLDGNKLDVFSYG